ncbi:MarR family winged helix-turn-helix transcriptional regulator, partial [Megasphaera stantonii]|uniref:MarR family winged helix-turn-helix transcriptional regulator n=1 Tax=Megasphaera stantonii TaxID=2144175 RepID=UPI0013004E4A
MEDPGLFEFRALLYRTSHAQRQLMHPFMASIGLGTGQPRLLSYLEENGPSSPRDLAEYYGLDPAGVSRMLDALSKKGLVA